MVKFTGKFKRKSAENYDEFLSQVGVGFMLRKAATASTPTMEISVKKLRTFWVRIVPSVVSVLLIPLRS